MTRLEALEQVLDLLQLSSEELSKMLVPSSHTERLKMKLIKDENTINSYVSPDPELSKYHTSLFDELVKILAVCYRTGILEIMEYEYETHQSVSQALHRLPRDFVRLCDLEDIIDTAQDNTDNAIAGSEIRLKRKPLYRSFIDHFTSLDEMKYVLEELAIKLSAFREEKIKPELRVKEDSNSTIEFVGEENLGQPKDETCKAKLIDYLKLDISIVTIIFLLEGVEVVDYNCIDEKIESIADGIFNKAKDYIERLDR